MHLAKVLFVFGALLFCGCDMNPRQAGDTGDDIVHDSSTGSAQEENVEDTGSGAFEEDESWREEEIEDHWQEGEPNIDGPCNDDCSYSYEMKMRDGEYIRGSSFFDLSSGPGGSVRARTGEAVVFIMAWTQEKSSLYRQQAQSDYLLNPVDHGLESGQVRIYNRFGDIRTDKLFNFEYDRSTDQLTYWIKFNGRKWGSTLSCNEPPLIMFNHREYPIITRGNHSSLFAFLIGDRYDWEAGGIQDIPVFSPEMERLDFIKVEKDLQVADRLIIHFPVDSAKTPWFSEYVEGDVYDINNVPIDYEHGIPVRMETRDHFYWYADVGFPSELNLSLVDETVDVEATVLPTDFQTVSTTVSSGTKTLNGELDIPEADGTYPVVILMTGWDHMTRRGEIGAVDLYRQLGAHLASNGYLVVRMDSPDNLAEATVAELSAHVVAIIQAMNSQTKADTDKIFLAAMGSGVHVASTAAKDARVNVDGIVIMSPLGGSFAQKVIPTDTYFWENAGLHQEFIEKQSLKITNTISALADDTYQGTYWRGHNAASWRSILNLDLTAYSSGLPPMLIIVGKEDHRVPPSAGADLNTAVLAAGGDSVFVELEGLTHAFTVGTKEGLWPQHSSIERISQTAVDALVQWLDSQGGAK